MAAVAVPQTGGASATKKKKDAQLEQALNAALKVPAAQTSSTAVRRKLVGDGTGVQQTWVDPAYSQTAPAADGIIAGRKPTMGTDSAVNIQSAAAKLGVTPDKLSATPSSPATVTRGWPPEPADAPTNDVLAQINQQVADRAAQINQQFADSDRRFYEEARTAAEKMRQQPSAANQIKTNNMQQPSTQQTTAQQTNPQLQALLDQMLGQVNAIPDYTARTEEERRAIAEGEYNPYYEQMRLAAQQAADRNTLALQHQKEGLQDTYDKQRAASQEAYDQAYSQADRQMLSRGMQRSSYGAQTLANISAQGNKAQQELWDAQGAAEGNIDAQITQLANQLSDTLQQYDANEAAQILSRIQELESQDYERGANAAQQKSQLLNQIYQNIYQAERDGKLDEQTAKQFELELAKFAEGQRQFDANNQLQWAQFNENIRQFNTSTEINKQQFAQNMQLYRDQLAAQVAHQNAQLAETIREFDISNARGQWEFAQTLQENKRQFNVSTQNQIDQFYESLKFQREQFAESVNQFNKELAEKGRQFDANLAMTAKQLQEQIREFDENLYEKVREFDVSTEQGAKQFAEQLAENIRQFDTSTANTLASAEIDRAYKTATAILAGGRVPSASLLEQAGIDAEDAQMLADIYAAGAKGSSGSRASSAAGTGNTKQPPVSTTGDDEDALIDDMGGDYDPPKDSKEANLFDKMGALIGGVVKKTSDVVEKLQDGTFANALTNALDPTNPKNKQMVDDLLDGLRKNKTFQTALSTALGTKR